ncbi:cysteine desulfurase family protein [Azohydromonas caseinilytica]|uniref:Cysteine desulfurase n=1 Tax=Azohydromonas caseinilytica TaxID=2728836 RepID=A0A848FCY2_9BURK|nr:cysteine desulfurase family protein [Azohydromonas caseinilytica]NML16143.1 cysteine desulfurase [Azohydromonas caseinilytica]
MNTATVYLDHNATTRPVPEAVAAMVQALQQCWANPSSTHEPGQDARRLLAQARGRVAAFLGCQAAEVVFTSGATEANHMALLGALKAGTRRRLVLSAVEHPGLLALGLRLGAEGVPVDFIPVDAQGRLDLAAARSLIRDDVALVSVMGANNETGVLMPVAELAALAHAAGAWMHVDATQLAGKAPLSFAASGADLMSVSAHKLGGPKGVGALLVRKGLPLPPLLAGRQERHRRGGTENLPGIAGFAAACKRAAATLAADIARMEALRRRLEEALLAALPGVHVYGRAAERLCNTLCLRFGTLDAEQVLSQLERAGIVASSGAACSAGGTQPSHVLRAMGESPLHAKAGVRLSLGPDTTPEHIAAAIAAATGRLRPLLAQAAAAPQPVFQETP